MSPIMLPVLIAFGALVPGLRFLHHPGPVGATAMTVAVLPGTVPRFAEAIFRAEAILLVFGIMIMVGVVLVGFWAKVCRT